MLESNKTRQLQNPSNSAALLAFKPRQVLLLSHSPAMAKKQQQPRDEEESRLKKKTLLQQSIINYLHLNGFSKTLKRFLQETHTQGDSWKSCSHNLEDIYYKYLNNCTDNDTNSKGNGEPEQCDDGTNGRNISGNAADSQETVSKKKKKKRSEDKNSDVPDASHPESVDKSTKNVINAEEVLADDKADKSLKKQKEKKKKKTEEKPEGVGQSKKKSEGAVPIGSDNNYITGGTTKIDKRKKSKKENGATDSKDSKKRKRLVSDENSNQGVEGARTEESKRIKSEGLEESKDVAGQGKADALCTDNGRTGSGNQEHNGEVSVGKPHKPAVKNIDANPKGNHQDELNNSAKLNSAQKERNGSAEPKTVNAFQRVKIDQVEFKDDRLKDNSYWAKDGAEVGYGAKAQEVLGQVKGRDFRHEKTKKKRGSYRGGQIDLQSHSIKFNYSDEE